jgi:hypothetical protein
MVGRVLGVVCCLVLADELVHVLSRDPDVKRVFVMRGEEGDIFERKIKAVPGPAEIIPIVKSELSQVSGSTGLTALVSTLRAGPHGNSGELRASIEAAVDEIRDHCDAIFLFYGLCRNSLYKTERIAERIGKPVTILTDLEGHPVDDCFGANIGGKRPYLDAIKKYHGTIFVFPGYAENWYRRQGKKDLVMIMEEVERMRFIFERTGYSKVMMLHNGLGDQVKFDERVHSFAKIFEFQVLDRDCQLEVFEHSYADAKKTLDWGVGSGK